MTRIKSAALRAPKSAVEATELLARFAAVSAAIAAANAEREALLTAANTAADAVLVPLEAELKDLHKRLAPWWETSADEMTGGKRRSIELGGCMVGYRMTPPKVAFDHGKDADAVDALVGTGWDAELLRVGKVSLDKPATLKRLQGDLHDELVPLELLGFSASQTEEFFVEPIGAGGPSR